MDTNDKWLVNHKYIIPRGYNLELCSTKSILVLDNKSQDSRINLIRINDNLIILW